MKREIHIGLTIGIGALFLAMLALRLSGCSTAPTVPGGVETQPEPSSSVSAPTPARGWVPEYDVFIHHRVTDELLAYPPESVCKNYKTLPDRAKFWINWLKATAYAESGFNRLDMYYESGISEPDTVTGLHNVSEGLLQLSYGDYQCKGVFDYAKDKTAFLDDYSRRSSGSNGEWNSVHPERTILNPYNNLECGIRILHMFFAGHPERVFQKTAGAYWSTVADGKVLAKFRTFMPECGK